MDFKRILRGPVIWILVALLVVLIGSQAFSSGGFARVDTADGLQLLREGKVQQAKIVDREQRVDLTLKSDYVENGENRGKRVQFFYVAPRGPAVVDAVTNADLPGKYTDEVPQDSFLGSLLITLLPLVIILALFWFLLSQMQGGGSRVMQFGKSRAKLVSKDTPKVT
ncbi:MAG: ATP-dependent metallopeptidase FtsH/Yme1/Tma family protein, partial [Actinomycetes bacterium]